ncbi:hypothetical protein AU198_16060 [Mycobacterium sp. GA-1199]|nr:hypothetical protein AU198_16060 [Mycobacterium sp. GA-1199]
MWRRPVFLVLAAGIAAVALAAVGVVTLKTQSPQVSVPSPSAEATTSTTRPPFSAPASTPSTRRSIPPTEIGAQGANYTIVDYIRENDITETPIKRGDPGSPTIDLPFPPGWSDAGPRTPEWAYGAIVSDDPAMAEDPPTIIALVSKLTGNVDPPKILEFAPNEIKNLPGYDGAQEGSPSTLSDFKAVQIGGTYTKDGVLRAIAQKTVVIPGQDGLYVLQLNADGREDQMTALMEATSVIDEQTKITP